VFRLIFINIVFFFSLVCVCLLVVLMAGNHSPSYRLYFLSASEHLLIFDTRSHIAHPVTRLPLVMFDVAPTYDLLLLTNYELLHADAYGANRISLAEVYAGDYVTALSFAPDSAQIVFAVSGRSGVTSVYWLPNSAASYERLASYSGLVRDLAWSPTGNLVAVGVNREGVYLVDMATHESQRLAVRARHPVWSPSGEHLLFLMPTSVDGTDFYRYDLRTSTTDNLTRQGNIHHEFPAWSPDGGNIAYVSLQYQQPDIELLSISDLTTLNLTQHPASDSRPVWSPDGSQIAFISDRHHQRGIYIMNADGSDVQFLTSDVSRKNLMLVWR
jgi:TolB protein